MNEKKTTNEARRAFLKKAAYVAPTVIALGAITKPVSAAASCTAANPCSKPSVTPSTNTSNNDEGGFKGGFN